MLKTSPKGLTLVELVIVIAILGIFTSISIIAFLNMVPKSKTKVDENTAKKIQRSIELYITQSNDSNLSEIPHSTGTELVENLQLTTTLIANAENDIPGDYGPYLEPNISITPQGDFTGWEITINTSNKRITVIPSDTNTCTIN